MILDLESLAKMANKDNIVWVDPDEMAAIVESIPERYDPKPKPPVKSKSVAVSWGFVCSKSESYEYDHHAPEYLRELEQWRVRNEHQGMKKLMFYGPEGEYEVRVRPSV